MVVLVGALIVQVAVLDQVVVLGAHPDVMVLIPVASGVIAGSQRGAVIGFVTGLVADLVVPLPYGISAIAFVIAGFLSGLAATARVGRDLPGAESVTVAALGTATTALYAVIAAVLHQPGVLSVDTADVLLIVALGGLVLSYPVLRLLRWCFTGSTAGSVHRMPSGGSALS